jgi:hypothetical protein
MSNYTSGNCAPTLMAQMPNNKGNVSKTIPVRQGTSGGSSKVVTHGTQGAPKAGGNPLAGGQKVSVSIPTPYNTKTTNDGYMNSNRNNFLK